MGDTGDDFKAFNEHKRKRRNGLEPARLNYALGEVMRYNKNVRVNSENIIIPLPGGTITFWPFTGWYQGQKPYGKIKGRGVKNLLKQLDNLNERNN